MPALPVRVGIKYGSYHAFQRYRCKDWDRPFNDKIGTIFAHARIALTRWFFAIYGFLRFNTSIRQLEAELNISYRTLRQRIERFAHALDAPSLSLSSPVEIDEVCVTAGKKGRERDRHRTFQLRRQLFQKPGREALKHALREVL